MNLLPDYQRIYIGLRATDEAKGITPGDRKP